MSKNFINQFQIELEKIKEDKKLYLIDNEINSINYFVQNYSTLKTSKSFKNHLPNLSFNYPNNNSIFKIDSKYFFIFDLPKIFNNYILYGLINYEDYKADKKQIDYVIDLAKYHEWLIELKQNLTSKPQQKKASLTLKQKLLCLYYLDLDLNMADNKCIAKILSQILDCGEENTRKYLSYICNGKNDVRTQKNLIKVNQIFNNAGLDSISDKIKKDIDKL